MRFIHKGDIVWDHLDWGDLGWVVRPANVPDSTNLTMLDVIIERGNGHDFHKHPNQQEVIYVLEGEIEQWVEDSRTILGAGEAAFVPMDTVHATFLADNAPKPARLLVVLGPSHSEAGYEVVDMSTEQPWATMR